MNSDITTIEMCTDIPDSVVPEEIRYTEQPDDQVNALTMWKWVAIHQNKGPSRNTALLAILTWKSSYR